MKNILLFAAALWCLPACLLAVEEKRAEPSRGQKIYYFQHRLLPRWTHGTNGAFYADMQAGKIERLTEIASQAVDASFAERLKVRALEGGTKILVAFEEPKQPPHCYFVLIEKSQEGFRFITLEMAEDILAQGAKTAMCGWTAEGAHQNFGPRKYSDEASFIAERSSQTNGTNPLPKTMPETALGAAH